jgi:hypothetical protein
MDNTSCAASVGEIFIYCLDLHHFKKALAQIPEVTPLDVQRVANKYLRPESMVIVAVGDASKIEGELNKLNLEVLCLASARNDKNLNGDGFPETHTRCLDPLA